MSIGIALAERGLVPDHLTRLGIRGLLRKRLRDEASSGPEAERARLLGLIAQLRNSPIAIATDKANEQHYEVPAAFYQHVLGRHLKYSSCLFKDGVSDLGQAEADMLALTCERADLCDGQDVLEIGCGWGSLSLWMAKAYPRSRILAVSNSHSQRAFITGKAKERGLANLEVVTANICDFASERRFDRVVSVECFEHLRNYQELFRRIAGWLRPDGRLFTHVFTHRAYAYPFATDGDDDWMGRHFFTGGIMPADQLFLYFQDHLAIEQHWNVSGVHYARTARCWLDNLDRERRAVLTLFAKDKPPAEAQLMVQRWRMFFMACEELFGYRGGSEWLVSHYRFRVKSA